MAAKNIDLPYNGEQVYWWNDGKRSGPGLPVMCIKANHSNGQIDVILPLTVPKRGEVVVGVPHVTDPRLINPAAASHAGGWELTEQGIEFRQMLRWKAEQQAASGAVANRKPKE